MRIELRVDSTLVKKMKSRTWTKIGMGLNNYTRKTHHNTPMIILHVPLIIIIMGKTVSMSNQIKIMEMIMTQLLEGKVNIKI